jgi:hypothetical protein
MSTWFISSCSSCSTCSAENPFILPICSHLLPSQSELWELSPSTNNHNEHHNNVQQTCTLYQVQTSVFRVSGLEPGYIDWSWYQRTDPTVWLEAIPAGMFQCYVDILFFWYVHPRLRIYRNFQFIYPESKDILAFFFSIRLRFGYMKFMVSDK